MALNQFNRIDYVCSNGSDPTRGPTPYPTWHATWAVSKSQGQSTQVKELNNSPSKPPRSAKIESSLRGQQVKGRRAHKRTSQRWKQRSKEAQAQARGAPRH